MNPRLNVRRARRLSLSLVLGALGTVTTLAPSAALAVGEQYGRIAGTLVEAGTKVPIPGALVKASSKALIGGPQTVQTGEDGAYLLSALPPGTYDLEFTAEGAKPLRRRVVVRQGETLPLNIAWSVEETQTNVVQIVEERHLTRPDATQTGTVLTADTQARVATPRTYQAVVQQVAGVTGGSNPNVKGGQALHNRYLVDGMDITDPVTNTFSANINFDSIASVEMMTGGMEAQYNSLGGILNLVTAAGGNEFKIDSSIYVNNQYFSLGQQFGPQLYNGARPFLDVARPPSQSYQANLNLSGPLIKNRLWFNASFEYYYRENGVPIGPPFNVQHPSQYSHRYLARLKLTWAPAEKHRITLSASADPAFFNNVDNINSTLAIAEDHQNQGGVFSILQWDYFISQKVNFNLQAGFQWSTLDGGPQGQYGGIDGIDAYRGDPRFSRFGARHWTYDPNQPQHVNQDDNTTWFQGGVLFKDRRYTAQFDPSVSVRGKLLGTHDAKFGFQSRFVYHSLGIRYPGGATYSDAGGGPLEAGVCDYDDKLGVPAAMRTGNGCYQRTLTPDWDNHQYGWTGGLFAQDRWKIFPWLALNPGLRFDYGFSRNSVGEQVSSLWGIGPRLGLVFDITRDQKTIFTAYYGRANETLSLLAASSADVTGIAKTQQFNPDAKKFEDLYQSGGPGGYRLSRSLTAPHADEVTISLRRELFANSAASIDYTYKRMGNIWDNVEINQIWDPSGQRVVGYANGKPEQILLYTTPEQNYRLYHGVDVVLESRPRQEWDFYVAYTLSFSYGPGVEQLGNITDYRRTQFYNPRQSIFYDGWLPEDQRHTLKIRASYNWKGLTAGAFMTYSTGRPLTKRYFSQYDGDYTFRRGPSGIDPGTPASDQAAFSDFRLPDIFNLDLRVSYDMHALIRQHVILIADLFNVFNLGQVTGIYTSDNGNFGKFNARQQPFRAQFGLRFMF